MAAKKSKRITDKAVQSSEKTPIPVVTVHVEQDNDPIEKDGLTVRQRSFVDHYLGPASFVATEAARMAGYSDDNVNSLKVRAHRTLHCPRVQEEIQRRLDRRKYSKRWIRESILERAAASMSNFVKYGDDGEVTIDFAAGARRGALGQVQEVTEEVIEVNGSAKVIKRKFKLFDPLPARLALAKMRGLLVDKVQVDGQVKHTHDHAVEVRSLFDKMRQDPKTYELAKALAERAGSVSGTN